MEMGRLITAIVGSGSAAVMLGPCLGFGAHLELAPLWSILAFLEVGWTYTMVMVT